MQSPTVQSTQPKTKLLAKRLRILVVEDDAPTRMAMTKLIRAAGADVVTARDGEEGLACLLAERFDVLLTDLRMPVVDGFELLQSCEKLPEIRRPGRVIAISGAYGASSLRGRGVPFLTKPLDIDALLKLLSGLPN